MKTSRFFPTEAAFVAWSVRNNLRPETIATIRRLREQTPNRRPQGRNNVKGFYSSTKMKMAMHFESHTNELPTILEFEYDPAIGEYYSQTGQLKLTYPDRSGKMTGCLHTPDLFRITETGAGWVECKTEQQLRVLMERMPNRYVRAEDGSWSSPPAEAAAKALGLTYEIRTRAEPSQQILSRNYSFIDDYFRRSYPEPDPKVVSAVHSAVIEHQGISLAQLLRDLEHKVTPDDLHYLIGRGDFYADLSKVLFIQPHKFQVFSDLQAAQIADATSRVVARPIAGQPVVQITPTAKVVIDSAVHTIVDADNDTITLRSDNTTERKYYKRVDFERLAASGKIVGFAAPDATAIEIDRRLAAASPADKAVAVSRWQTIEPYLTPTKGRKLRRLNRTQRRWLTNFRKSQDLYGNGFIALIPKKRSGNTYTKIEPEVRELMIEVITTILESKKNPTSSFAFGKLRLACEEKGFVCPSMKAFRQCANSRSTEERVTKTLGPRSGKKLRKFIYFLDATSPVHGDRPWEIVHIDHTQLDIELVCSETGVNLGRPWLTLMVDAFTRRILAISVSFASPNILSCMRVIRECVRRHNRLPHIFVIDNGREFESIYFEALLANFSLHKKSRPSGHPRFGAVCERLFGTVNTEFIHNLIGNTKHMKNARMVTKSFNPKLSAIWTLENLTEGLAEFCFEVYDNSKHPSHTLTPRVAYENGMKLSGERKHTLIPYNTTLEILTMPTNKSGFAKVHNQKGVHLNYLDYWCKEFASIKLHGELVPVRFDPDNIAIAYAFVDGEWRQCISRNAYVFLQSSVSSIKAAAKELLQRNSKHAKGRQVTARQVADFMEKIAEREDTLLEGARQRASMNALNILSGKGTSPAPKPATPPKPNNVAQFPSGMLLENTSHPLPLDVNLDCELVMED